MMILTTTTMAALVPILLMLVWLMRVVVPAWLVAAPLCACTPWKSPTGVVPRRPRYTVFKELCGRIKGDRAGEAAT